MGRQGLGSFSRGVVIEPRYEGSGVYLEELLNPSIVWEDGREWEWPFRSTRFRPIVDADPPRLRETVRL